MPGPSGPSPRKIGLTLATLMAIVFIAIIWSSMSSSSTPQSSADNLFPTDPSEIPNLEDLEQGASMFVTIVDRDDPTRIAGTLEADQFEPIGGGQRRLVNPDAWIFLRDGRRVHITANDGLVMMPDPNQAPDSGTLEGDVTINAYDAPVDGISDPADPMSAAMGITPDDNETPSFTARFDKPVEFERRYQRLTSQGRFVIDAPALNFIGHNLTVMLNEVKGRVELIDIRRGEQLILRPDAQTKTPQQDAITKARPRPSHTIRTVSQDSTTPQTSPTRAKSTQQPKPSSPPKQTPYHIEFQDQVLVNLIGSGTLNAETLDVWANLIDGSLSPDAIKQLKFKTQDTTTAPEPQKQTAHTAKANPESTDPAPTAQPSSAPKPTTNANTITKPKATAQEGEVLVTWSGPLVVKPIEDPSTTALASEELALRFNSDERVRFASADKALTGSATQLSYGATTATLDLLGSDAALVTLNAQDAGTLSAESINADLVDGLISIPSSGRLESQPQPDQPPAQIDWSQAAEFTLVKSETNELTGRLQSANFQGQVVGTRDDAVLRAMSLDAEFESTGPIESALRTIAFNQGTLNSDSGSLSAQAMTVGFSPSYDHSSVNPTTLDAQGEVLIISPDGRITSDELNAILTQSFDGQTEVRTAHATGNAEFLGQNETRANGNQLDLDNPNNTIHIIGAPNSLATAGQAGSTIQGPDIRINTRSRSIRVNGAGTFDHDIVAEGTPTGGHLNVRWSDSMRFDDALGSIKCEGDVVAVSTPDAYTIDTVKADRLEIDLTPAPGTDALNQPTKLVQDNEPQRELFQARAYGRAVPGADDIPASVESRSFDPANPEVAVGVMFLQGPQLIADNRAQTLNVPASGMMILMDRSPDQPGGQSPESATVMPNTSGPGLTRMTWLGSMTLDRANGFAQVVSEVNIRHKSLTTGRVSQLGCEQLTAEFTPQSSSGSAAAPITMHSANASGRVRFTDLNRTLLSDHAIYNAQNETLFAYADDNRLVTLRDSTEPTPVSARTLLWDLRQDLIEIDAPSPVRAPARP